MGEEEHVGCLRKEKKNSGTAGRWRKKKMGKETKNEGRKKVEQELKS